MGAEHMGGHQDGACGPVPGENEVACLESGWEGRDGGWDETTKRGPRWGSANGLALPSRTGVRVPNARVSPFGSNLLREAVHALKAAA